MNKKRLSSQVVIYILTALAAALYLWFVLSAPISTATEELRVYTTKIKYVRLVLSIGYIVSWFAGAYVISKLKSYLNFIKDGKEGAGFKQLYLGLVVLTIGTVLWPIASAYRATVLDNSQLIMMVTFIFNGLIIIPTLISSYLMYAGSKDLLKSFGFSGKVKAREYLFFAAPVLFMPIYLWLIFTNAIRSVSPAPGIPSTFYLSDLMIALLVVLPALISWILGLLSVINLRSFKKQTEGVVYRSMFSYFGSGLAATVLGSLLLQGVVSVGTSRLLALGPVILTFTVYTFVTMTAIGLILIARGIGKLQKLEE